MKSKLSFLLVAVVFLLGMAGCATTSQAGSASAAAQPDPRETYAAAMAGCANAIKDIVGGAGDAVAKVVAVGSIERLCGNGGAQLAAAMQPQPVQQPDNLVAVIWQAMLQVGDIALRGYGIKTQRDVSLAQTYANAATAQASYAAFSSMGNTIGSTATGIATSGFNALAVAAARPVLPTTSITVNGNGNNTGSGTQNTNSHNQTTTTTRTCTGGNGGGGGNSSVPTGGATTPGGGTTTPGGAAGTGNC